MTEIIAQNENDLCVYRVLYWLCIYVDLFSPLGPMSAPRAGSSRGPVVADPAVATRTNLFLMQSDENKRLY